MPDKFEAIELMNILEQIRKARTVTIFFTELDKKKNTKSQISTNIYFEDEKKAVNSFITALSNIGCKYCIDDHKFGNPNHLIDIYLSKKKRISVWINMVELWKN